MNAEKIRSEGKPYSLTKSESRVWAYFLMRACESGLVKPPQRYMAEQLDLSVTTISRSTRKFTELGWVQRVQSPEGWNVVRINNYAPIRSQRVTSTGNLLRAV